MKQFICHACEAEYEIVHDIDAEPLYCPFCGELNLPDIEDDEEAEYDDE
jgi:hypothetical protein